MMNAKRPSDKLDVEHRPYGVLGPCNPLFAYRAIKGDADIGLLLRCNVVVREEADKSTTNSLMDLEAVLKLVDNKAEVTALAGKHGHARA